MDDEPRGVVARLFYDDTQKMKVLALTREEFKGQKIAEVVHTLLEQLEQKHD